MSTFNPYSHWLGLIVNEKPDTYYELLGLPRGEKSMAKIAEAVEAANAKVQKVGPDGHFPEWNQLLTEIQIAKNCLCNPKYKADYDAKHPASTASSVPAPSAAVAPGMASPFDMQPRNPQPAEQAQPQPQVQPQVQPQPQMQAQQQMPGMMGMQPGVMPMQPGMMGMQPGMMPMQPGMMGMQPGMMPMQPGMMGMQPGMMPMQPGMMPVQNMYGGVAYTQPGMGMNMNQPVTPVQPQVAPMQPQVAPIQPQVAPAQVASPFGAVSGPASAPMTQSGPVVSPLEGVGDLFGTSSTSSGGVKSVASKTASKPTQKTKAAKTSASGPTPMQRNIIAVVGLLIIAILGFMLWNQKPEDKPIQVVVDENGQTSIQVKNPLANEQTPQSASTPSTAPVTEGSTADAQPAQDAPQEEAKLEKPDFDGILSALRNHDFVTAQEKIKVASSMNVSPDDEKRLERMILIKQYASNFYKEIEELLGRMAPPQELCKGEYGLVNVGNQSATIRINGQNITFTMTEPNHRGYNFYDILYRHKFEESVINGNMNHAIEYATFEMLTPNGDQKKAVKLFQQVQKDGTDADRETVQKIQEELGTMDFANVEAVTSEEKAEAPKAEETPETGNPEEKAEDSEKKADEEDVEKSRKKSKAEKEAEEASAKEKEKAEKAAAQEKERHERDWKQLATEVRRDIGTRHITPAKKSIDQLEKIAQTDEEKKEIHRLEVLTDYTASFTKWVGNYMGGFTPGTSVKAGDAEIGIVESAPGRLLVRDQGVNRTYTTENLNPVLVEWLVGKSLKTADDYVLYGTYLAMDPEGNRTKAKEYWETAGNKGFDKETIALLKEELEVPLVDEGKRSSSSASSGRGGKNQAAEKQEVPKGADYDKAMEDLKKEYAKDYEKTDVQGLKKLSEKFLKLSQLPKTPAATAYVMTEEAARVAQENNFYETAFQALKVQETRFGQDTYNKRMEMVKKADPNARGSASVSEYVNCAMGMSFDAIQRGKKIEANQMMNIAREHAKGAQVKKTKQLEAMINQMK